MARRVPIAVIVLMLVAAACGGSSDSGSSDAPGTTTQAKIPTDLAQVASFTCNQLGGATVESAVPILTKALPKATSIGYAPAELGAALRAKCPETMTPLEVGAEVTSLLGG